MGPDYHGVTEVPGARITPEALAMAYARYAFAVEYCAGKDVLELACGAGQGLGFLATKARSVVGADRMESLLRMAREGIGRDVPLVALDAVRLPFRQSVFDVIVLNEALYYLDTNQFWSESRRVLRPSGQLVITTINCRWPDFNPSPYSVRYHTASSLREEMSDAGFDVEVFGGFNVHNPRGAQPAISALKRLAVRLRLIPRTMKGKAALKRLFYGRLVDAPAAITDAMAPLDRPARLAAGADASYKVLYAIGKIR